MLKTIGLKLSRCLGLYALSRHVTQNALRILCYHGIWLPQKNENPFNFLFMRAERFVQRMELLRNRGYCVLPLDTALHRLHANRLPKNAIAITIDDGWYGTYTHMVPELTRLELPATIYLSTYYAEKQTSVFGVALRFLLTVAPIRRLPLSHIGLPTDLIADLDIPNQREAAQERIQSFGELELGAEEREDLLMRLGRELGWDWNEAKEGRYFHLMSLQEAKDAASKGIDFQLHTHRHRIRHGETSVLEAEISDNRDRLRRIADVETRHFCYPSGEWQADLFGALHTLGITSATTTDIGLCTSNSAVLALPRIMDGDKVSQVEFEAETCGMMELFRQLTGKRAA